jgi:hypothetical protein
MTVLRDVDMVAVDIPATKTVRYWYRPKLSESFLLMVLRRCTSVSQ